MTLRGVLPVLLTPFLPNGKIDDESLRKEVDFAINAGAAGVCSPAFGSEYYKLSDPERYEVTRIVVEQPAGRLPVWASTGSGSVHATVEFSRYAESIGATGVMGVAPKIVPLGLKELTSFYEGVCRSVKIPVMIQDADFTGSGLPADFLVSLSERFPNFQFAKLESVLVGPKCSDILRLSGGKLQVLYGLGGIALPDGLARGACGVTPGVAVTDLYARIFHLWDAGRHEVAKSLFYRFQPYLVFALQHLELLIGMEKRILVRRGVLSSDRLRAPTPYFDDQCWHEAEEWIEFALRLCEEGEAPNIPQGP